MVQKPPKVQRALTPPFPSSPRVSVDFNTRRCGPASDTVGSRSDRIQGRTWHVDMSSAASQQNKHWDVHVENFSAGTFFCRVAVLVNGSAHTTVAGSGGSSRSDAVTVAWMGDLRAPRRARGWGPAGLGFGLAESACGSAVSLTVFAVVVSSIFGSRSEECRVAQTIFSQFHLSRFQFSFSGTGLCGISLVLWTSLSGPDTVAGGVPSLAAACQFQFHCCHGGTKCARKVWGSFASWLELGEVTEHRQYLLHFNAHHLQRHIDDWAFLATTGND